MIEVMGEAEGERYFALSEPYFINDIQKDILYHMSHGNLMGWYITFDRHNAQDDHSYDNNYNFDDNGIDNDYEDDNAYYTSWVVGYGPVVSNSSTSDGSDGSEYDASEDETGSTTMNGDYGDYFEYTPGSGEGRTLKKRKGKELKDADEEEDSDPDTNEEGDTTATEIYGGCIPRPRISIDELNLHSQDHLASIISQAGVDAESFSHINLGFIHQFIRYG